MRRRRRAGGARPGDLRGEAELELPGGGARATPGALQGPQPMLTLTPS